MTGLTGRKLERYLYDDCALLALAVRARTGWDVVQIIDGDPDNPEVEHVLVRMPDGRLLDAAGPHDDYSGEEPYDDADWLITDSMWRKSSILADADELLRASAPGHIFSVTDSRP